MSDLTITPAGPRAPRGYRAAGAHHAYPLAKHRGTGALVAHDGVGWLPVAVVVKVDSHVVTVACPNGCVDRRRPRVHYHGRGVPGGSGEGPRAPHCGRPGAPGYLVLDIDALTAPPTPPQNPHGRHLAVVASTPQTTRRNR